MRKNTTKRRTSNKPPAWMAAHEASDIEQFGTIRTRIATLATKEDLKIAHESLATKEDVKQVLEVFSNIKTAAGVVTIGTTWGFRTILVIASLVIAIGAITGGLKAALISIALWPADKI